MWNRVVDRLPWPLWCSCCGRGSWTCWIDEVCHSWFPMTFGFQHVIGDDVVWFIPLEQTREPWCCRQHRKATDAYGERWLRKHPD